MNINAEHSFWQLLSLSIIWEFKMRYLSCIFETILYITVIGLALFQYSFMFPCILLEFSENLLTGLLLVL